MKRFFLSTYFFVLVAVVVTIIILNWLASIYLQRYYRDVIRHEQQEISRGCFYLLEQELLGGSEAEYGLVIERLKPRFGYPIDIGSSETFRLSPEEQRMAAQGDIIVRDEPEFYLKRIGQSSLYVSMGPFAEVDLKAMEESILVVIGSLFLGMFLLPWSILFWRKLDLLGTAVKAFGEGNFATRVAISRFSSLSSIASTFNSMAEQIERLIFSHKQLVNAVSHELRTPISRIRFGLEELRTADESERDRQLSGIRNDIDELEDLVSELLSYSRFERMDKHFDLRPRPLLPWLQDYLEFARESYDIPIAFAWHDFEVHRQVEFDPRLLERALHNLLQNGYRYAATRISVELTLEGGKAVIRVGDDGPGIPKEHYQRIFDPFVRLDSSRNRGSGGYGLGLSIVREIVRGHNGTITIRKSVLGGAEFCISLLCY